MANLHSKTKKTKQDKRDYVYTFKGERIIVTFFLSAVFSFSESNFPFRVFFPFFSSPF